MQGVPRGVETQLQTYPAVGLPVDEGDWDTTRPLETVATADTLAEAPGEVLWLKLAEGGGVPI